jgi:hypothetical protein
LLIGKPFGTNLLLSLYWLSLGDFRVALNWLRCFSSACVSDKV